MITKFSASSIANKTWYRSMLAGNTAYAPPSMELISTTILGSSATSVTFDVTGLGSTYKHLQIRATSRTDAGTYWGESYYRLNSDTGSNYAFHWMVGNGTNVSSSAGASAAQLVDSFGTSGASSGSAFGASVIDFADVFSTVQNKTVRILSGRSIGGGEQRVALSSGAWFNTAAVTSITAIAGPTSNTFAIGSRFSIYGIRG